MLIKTTHGTIILETDTDVYLNDILNRTKRV